MRTQSLFFTIVFFSLYSSSSVAGAIKYAFSSTCEYDCYAASLSTGDPVFGMVDIYDTAISPGAKITEADIAAFTMTFGTITVDDTTAEGLNFGGTVSLDLASISISPFIAADSVGGTIAPRDDIFAMSANFTPFQWEATSNGKCSDPTCSALTIPFTAKGPLTRTTILTRVSPIPIPAAVWLFGTGLLSLIGISRRKKAV